MRLVALLLAGLAAPAFAQPAQWVLTCTHLSHCDARGACTPTEGATEYALTPVKITPPVNQQWLMSVDGGADVEAARADSLAPIIWDQGRGDDFTRDSLTILGETAVHTRLFVGSDPAAPGFAATLTFMACERKDP